MAKIVKSGTYAGYTEARKRANARYEAETVERISLVLPRGMKNKIKVAAAQNGESVNGFLCRIISKAIAQNGTHTISI